MSTRLDINLATTDLYIDHSPNMKILTTGSDTITNKIINCLTTEKGSRPWEPTWGSDITQYCFEPCDATSAYDIETLVLESLNTFFRNDITLNSQGVKVFPDPDNQTFNIFITYSSRATGVGNTIKITLMKSGER